MGEEGKKNPSGESAVGIPQVIGAALEKVKGADGVVFGKWARRLFVVNQSADFSLQTLAFCFLKRFVGLISFFCIFV